MKVDSGNTGHAPQNDPGLSSMGWGSNWTPCFRSTKPSVLHVRADCGGRLFGSLLVLFLNRGPKSLSMCGWRSELLPGG